MALEIEKKYKIKYLPKNLNDYEYMDIEQSYLNFGSKPAIRLRRIDNTTFILCCKIKHEDDKKIQTCDEYELPLSKETYYHLKSKIDGRVIYKRRYIIPIEDKLKVELDLFSDFFDGVCFAEIEFSSKEQYKTVSLPDWIGEDITEDERIANGYMAVNAISINEYDDLLIKDK